MSDTSEDGRARHEDPLVGHGNTDLVVSTVFFDGQIPEAVMACQTKKKTLLVYISGDNEESRKMDEITFQDSKVHEKVMNCCVALRLVHGSADAAYFSAMYPYDECPSTALVSDTGLLLKQHRGYVGPADLLAILEEASTNLYWQKTTAMVAALASMSAASSDPSPAEGRSEEPPPMTEENRSAVASSSTDNEMFRTLTSENHNGHPQNIGKEVDTSCGTPSEEPSHTCVPSYSSPLVEEEPPLKCNVASVDVNAFQNVPTSPGSGNLATNCNASASSSEGVMSESPSLPSHSAIFSKQPSLSISSSSEIVTENASLLSDNRTMPTRPSEEPKLEKVILGGQRSIEQRDNTKSILLQIRLTNGESLRNHFTLGDTLTVVKEFVDSNRTDGNTGFSLAIPYPRRVLTHEDMEKSLLELGLEERGTLILIAKGKQQETPCQESCQPTNAGPNNDGSTGFWWRILSYLNPFSHLFGSTTEGKNNVMEEVDGTPSGSLVTGAHKENEGTLTRKDSSRAPNQKWGSNVHTLQHDEDNDDFKKGNAFWNGNSTQYGGGDSKQ